MGALANTWPHWPICHKAVHTPLNTTDKIGDTLRPARAHLDQWGYQVGERGVLRFATPPPQSPGSRINY